MDRHKQFITHNTSEVRQLIIYQSPNFASATNLFRLANKVVQDSYKYAISLELLKTVRSVLCLCYQYTFYSDNGKKGFVSIQKNMIAFDRLDIDKMKSSLDEQLKKKDNPRLTEVCDVLLDILVLHMTLYNKVSDIVQSLKDVQNLIYQGLEKRNDLTIFQRKLMVCYIDGLLLHKERASIVDGLEGERVKALFLQNLQLWLKLKDPKNSDLLVVILPKLMKVGSPSGMLTKVWRMIVTVNNSTNTVGMLHLTADIWFPIESELIKQLIVQSLEERLWLLLLKELGSSSPQRSRPALQLTKKVVDFIDRHRTEIIRFPKYKGLRPLVCTGNDFQQEFFKGNLKNWFLILEELEKEREHSVTPAFSLLRNLLKKTPAGLHIAWIRCTLSRILQDASNVVVKWGLLEVFALDLELYNDEFLRVMLNALNNTSFYEIDTDDGQTTIAKELTIFLNHAETQNTDLVTRFIVQASKKTWDPIPLFHIIHALSMVERKKTTWTALELKAVKSLAEIISTIRCPILRIGSHVELLEVMTHFAMGSLNLVAVASTLSAFPTSEALIRDQLAWKRTSTWLSNTVKETEAIDFLETVCRQMATDNSQKDLSMKSLSLIIMLFYDGYLALNSTVSPGFTALRNLLNCLNEEGSKSRSNAELKIRAIELLGCLLDVTMLKDCILNELVSNYANATLRWTFKNLRTIFDESVFNDMSTYVRITQQLFTANSSIITKRDMLDHIEKFQCESRNIIEDGEFNSNVKRFFGIKILHACLKATSTRLRNYRFIESLYKTYKDPLLQSSGGAKGDCKSHGRSGIHKREIASGYYKIVAELFYEYLKDEPVDEWLPNIDWIKEVLYLIQVGGERIAAPLVEVLSQIFYKETVGATHIDDFKSAVKLCWKSILESNECSPAFEEILDLLLSSPFLECKKTKELTIECIREITTEEDETSVKSVILIKRLNQVNGEYLCNFYEAILACLLRGNVPSNDQKIELQARSYVLDCYQEVYPSYLSAMNSNTNTAARGNAVTLLHRTITNDPAHAVQLLPLIVQKLEATQSEQDVHDSQTRRLETRILQVLLVLQPMLSNGDVESLHSLLCNSISSESSQPSVRVMQEWLLIRIYLESNKLRAKIWDLFDQCQARRIASLCSVMGIVYHVARLLSPDLQLNFMNYALQRIMPYCMSQQSNVPVYAQVITTKLYDLATDLSYSAITERYRDLQAALTESRKHGDLKTKSAELQDSLYFKNFHPINDYTLQTLFHELPRALNVPWDELIPTQMFEKSGFRKVNNHPLKLLDPKSDTQPLQQMTLTAVVTISAESRKIHLKETSSISES